MQEHWYLIDRSHLVHHIGLKADTDETLHGYLGDLMVLGKALNETGIKRISGAYRLTWEFKYVVSMCDWYEPNVTKIT